MSVEPENKPKRRIRNRRRVKVPISLQMEAVECGAACLTMVLAHFGRRVSLEQVRVECGVSRDGSKAKNMVIAAEKYGLHCAGYKKEPEQLKDLPLPMIIHWNFNHFVVLTGIGRNKYFLNDPGPGPRVVSSEEFDRAFTGVVLTFEKGPDFKKGGHEPSLFLSLLRRVKNYKLQLMFVFIVGLLLVVPHLAKPTLSRVFYDEVLVQGHYSWVRPIIFGLVLTTLVMAALSLLENLCMLRLETQLAISSTTKFMRRLFRLPMDFFLQRTPGDIQFRVNLNDRVVSLLSNGMALNFVNVMMIAFYGFILFHYNVMLSMIGVFVCLLNILVLRYSARIRSVISMVLVQEKSKMAGSLMNGLQIIETLRSTGTDGDFLSRLFGNQAKTVNAGQKMSRISIFLGSIPPLLSTLNQIVILFLGAIQIIDGWFTVGMLVAFRSLMGSFTGPLNKLVGLGASVQQLKGDMTRLDDVLDHEPDAQFNLPKTDLLKDDKCAKLDGYLELRDITFGYSRLEEPLIQNFNLKLTPGQRVALVGSSGSGKSTVAKLVAGLYQPWKGEVLFDHQPRSTYSRDLLSHSVSLVDQDIFLFDGTIKENISMWDENVYEDEVFASARDADIHEDIAARPHGFEGAMEENGRNFSGGQRQRLDIARALFNDPSILIMDEATSALDPNTENSIDTNLRRRGISCLIIAHRLSTIRDCDEIIVLDKGNVVQRGIHDDLVKDEDGLYYDLVKTR